MIVEVEVLGAGDAHVLAVDFAALLEVAEMTAIAAEATAVEVSDPHPSKKEQSLGSTNAALVLLGQEKLTKSCFFTHIILKMESIFVNFVQGIPLILQPAKVQNILENVKQEEFGHWIEMSVIEKCEVGDLPPEEIEGGVEHDPDRAVVERRERWTLALNVVSRVAFPN